MNELSNLNKNTQNLSILVRYANFYVKNLRKNNEKMTQFHWSRKSRDSCPTSSEQGLCFTLFFNENTWQTIQETETS